MASHEQFMIDYHKALCQEIEQSMPNIASDALKTLYFGGGTPSTYPAPLLLDTFAILRKYFIFDPAIEITIEVNPGTVTKDLVRAWHEVGINRLSIGVQSLKDQVLKALNRQQTVEQVHTLLQEAQQYFKNISVDFILGLPGVSDQDWKLMIEEAMTWPITHISIYFLMVHENTPLYFKVQTAKINLPPDDALVDLYDWTVDYLAAHGFYRYELSNFAKNGFESLHNKAYWDRKAYRGYGLGACSFNGEVRFQNSKNLGHYIAQNKVQQSVIEMVEVLTAEQIAREKIMLGLRCERGMLIQEYVASLNQLQQDCFFKAVAMLQQAQLLVCEAGVIRLTPKGFALENEVIVRLFPE